MARNEKELKGLLTEIKTWFTQEMGIEYKHAHISNILEEIKAIRFSRFVHRRLGHLPDQDLIKFINICQQDANPPAPIIESKIEVARGKTTKR